MSRSHLVCALVLVFAAPAAFAQETTPPPSESAPPPASQPTQFHATSSQEWPGRFQVGLHPLGVQARFDGNSVSGYKFTGDVAGLLKSYDKFSLWLGGGFNYTYGSLSYTFSNHDMQLWAFAMMTLEKLIHFPLVPFVRAGIGGDILLYDVTGGSLTGGAFIIRVGGGAHYYVTKNIGLGVETNFTFGPGVYPAAVFGGCGFGNNSCTSFYGTWDFLIGARFAF
jgi:hypothetical protein